MSSESVRQVLPLPRLSGTYEATLLYRELRKPLLRYLVCLGLTTDEAQDVVQDTFLGLHQHLTSGGAQDNIRSWIFRVAHNQARNRQQSYHRRFGTSLDPTMHSGVDNATPERSMLEKEKFGRLEKAMLQLADPERECLLLRVEGLRYREIGEVLGIPTSTVADTVTRAIKKLAEECNV
jgi:RNA polymerase sigma-70 factor (ECF subfamily)